MCMVHPAVPGSFDQTLFVVVQSESQTVLSSLPLPCPLSTNTSPDCPGEKDLTPSLWRAQDAVLGLTFLTIK